MLLPPDVDNRAVSPGGREGAQGLACGRMLSSCWPLAMSLDASAVLPSRSGCQAVSDHKPPVSQLQSYPVSRVTAWSFSSCEEVFPGGGGALPWQRVTQFPAESETVPGQAGPCIRMAVPVWYLRDRQVFCG